MSAVNWTTVENALQAWVTAAAQAVAAGTVVIWSQQAGPRPVAPWISLKLWGLKRDGIGWVDTVATPLLLTPLAVTGEASSILAVAAHGLNQGDGPVQVESSGTIPAGLTASTDYWAVPTDAGHLQLATSYANAIASSPVTVTITSAGSGTVTLVSTPATLSAGAEITHTVRCYFSAILTIQCYASVANPTGPQDAVAILHEVQARSLLPSVRNALEDAGIGVVDQGSVNAIGAVINTTQFEPRAVCDIKLWLTSEVSETDTIIDIVQGTLTVTDVAGDTVATEVLDVSGVQA